ncbi:MAG: hypothetical protein AAB110_06085, partial [Candidatus Desantisbacteria bacterium]
SNFRHHSQLWDLDAFALVMRQIKVDTIRGQKSGVRLGDKVRKLGSGAGRHPCLPYFGHTKASEDACPTIGISE